MLKPVTPSQRARVAMRRGASTRSQVYAIIREAVVSLHLLPGQALSENELATQYGVSRTPVREALIRLAGDGLVEVVPQLGTFVSRISELDVREAQFIREVLECTSLQEAIKRVTEQDARRLREIIALQREATEAHDITRWFALDESLHRTLLEVAGHPRVWPIVHSAKAHLDRVRMLSLPEAIVLEELVEQHSDIVEHVIGKRRRQAESVLTQHLRLVFEYLEPFKQRYPDYFLLDEGDDV